MDGASAASRGPDDELGGADRLVRAGLPPADRGSRDAGHLAASRRPPGGSTDSTTPRRPTSARSACWRGGSRSGASGSSSATSAAGTPTTTCKAESRRAGSRHRQAHRRPADRPEGSAGCGTTRWWSGEASSAGRRPARGPTAATTIPTATRCGWPAAASRPGLAWGKTDDYGYYAVEDKVHVHDLHATILHLLGLDHKRLTYRYAGRDFRLTDVHGELVKGNPRREVLKPLALIIDQTPTRVPGGRRRPRPPASSPSPVPHWRGDVRLSRTDRARRCRRPASRRTGR